MKTLKEKYRYLKSVNKNNYTALISVIEILEKERAENKKLKQRLIKIK
jgi:hypothetical protein